MAIREMRPERACNRSQHAETCPSSAYLDVNWDDTGSAFSFPTGALASSSDFVCIDLFCKESEIFVGRSPIVTAGRAKASPRGRTSCGCRSSLLADRWPHWGQGTLRESEAALFAFLSRCRSPGLPDWALGDTTPVALSGHGPRHIHRCFVGRFAPPCDLARLRTH